MHIIFAHVIHVSQTVYLKHLVSDHHSHFRQTFPNARMINKHHHMVHYPTCIRKSGPLVTMQCLKYELKHGFSKRMAGVNCNFKNICMSVACKHQVLQCAQWSCGKDGLRMDFECSGGSTVQISSLEGSATVTEELHCEEGANVFLATQVALFGTNYKPKLYLALSISDDGEPQFGRISAILVFGNNADSVKFVVRKCQTVDFITHFHAYKVCDHTEKEFSVVMLKDLLDYLPLSGLSSYEENSSTYLCPRCTLQQLPRYILHDYCNNSYFHIK